MASPKAVRYAMSRRKKNAIIFVFFFLFLPAVMVVDHLAGPPIRQALVRRFFYTEDQKQYHQQSFPVLAIIDGDTLDVGWPDGDSSFTRIRLLGIDTPETRHPTAGVMYFGPEATDFTRSMIDGSRVTVLLDTVGDQRDMYGRLLAYIQMEDGRILNEEIIRRGFGYADLRFEHSQSDLYEGLMEEAIASQAGLWKKAVRDQLPPWLRQKRPLLLRSKAGVLSTSICIE